MVSIEQCGPKIIESDRYNIVSTKELGRGAWGVIYPGRDEITHQEVAIKVFDPNQASQQKMAKEGLTERGVMRAEVTQLAPCSRIVPRIYDEDKLGKPFIVMPMFQDNLARRIGDGRSFGYHLGNGISEEELNGISLDIATGLRELHTILGKTHHDVWPGNVLFRKHNHDRYSIKEDHAYLSDLGSSTCISTVSNEDFGGRENSDRPRGYFFCRAPEKFRGDNLPDHYRGVDSFSAGAVIYRMLFPQYPLEKQLSNARNPEQFIKDLGIKAGNALIDDQLDKVPRDWRPILKACLNFDMDKRISNGKVLYDKLEDLLESMTVWGAVKKHSKSTMKYLSAATVLGSLIGYGVYNGITTRPTETIMPKIVDKGATIVGNPVLTGTIAFEQEKFSYPRPMFRGVPVMGVGLVDRLVKNAHVAHFVRAYMGNMEGRGFLRGDDAITPAQWAMYNSQRRGNYSAPTDEAMRNIDVLNASISYAMNMAKKSDNLVDLEDVCVITRVGPMKWNEARRKANSFDYAQYSKYLDPSERTFIDGWRSELNRTY